MYRKILNEIQHLIDKGNGATEAELKQIWNELSNTITETEQSNIPAVIKSVCPVNLLPVDGKCKYRLKDKMECRMCNY